MVRCIGSKWHRLEGRQQDRNKHHCLHTDALAAIADQETSRARAEVIRLDNEERKLLTAHYSDRISDHTFHEEQQRIRRERIAADELLRRYQVDHATILETLDLALDLTDNIQAAYLQAAPVERRLINQAFFEAIEIDDEEIAGHALVEPFNHLAPLATGNQHPASQAATGPKKDRTPDPYAKAGGSYVPDMVERIGIEPMTSALQRRRSPS